MRRVLVIAGTFGAAALLLLVLAYRDTVSVRGQLDSGRDGLVAARRALTEGDFAAAEARFVAAASSFDEAADGTRSPAYRVVAAVPFLGRTFDAGVALADGGGLTADAGRRIAATFDRVGGIDGIVGPGGRIDVAAIPPLARTVEAVTPLLRRASEVVHGISMSFVVGSVAAARATAIERIDAAAITATIAGPLLQGMPAFLGAEEPVTYLVGAENPSELRGSGGVIGAYSILRIEDGRMALSRFREIQTLPVLSPDDIEPPSDDYARLYDPERGGGRSAFWLNVNLTPDFPNAALAFERSFEAATGTEIDGVITADPFALAALVAATGPTDIPELGITVEADDVVPLLSSEGFGLIEDSARRKAVLGAAAGAILDRALSDADAGVVRHLLEAAGDGHLKVYSDDPAMQSALERTGAGGALPVDDGDLLAVVVNNAAGNKLDYYAHRAVTYDVWLQPDGAARAELTIELTNATPDVPLPSRVLGSSVSEGAPGSTVSLVNAYCVRCTLSSVSQDGSDVTVTGGDELGATFFQRRVELLRGDSTELDLAWASTGAWDGDGSAGTYHLTLQGQATIVPTEATVRIHLPEDTEVTHATDGVSVDGATATWTGVTLGRTDVTVSFDTPWPLSVWRDVTSAFG